MIIVGVHGDDFYIQLTSTIHSVYACLLKISRNELLTLWKSRGRGVYLIVFGKRRGEGRYYYLLPVSHRAMVTEALREWQHGHNCTVRRFLSGLFLSKKCH